MRHTCHAEKCDKAVPPRMFMCRTHWYMLPKAMRDAVWQEYTPGQERTKTPTTEYLNVARRAVRWLAVKEGHREARAAE